MAVEMPLRSREGLPVPSLTSPEEHGLPARQGRFHQVRGEGDGGVPFAGAGGHEPQAAPGIREEDRRPPRMELVPEMVQHMVEQCPGRHVLDELQAEVLQVAEHGPHAVRRAGGHPGPPGLGDGERDAGPGGGIALIPEPHLEAEGS